MGLIFDKLGRILVYTFAANGFVYRCRKNRYGLRGCVDELPSLSEARCRMLGLRPPLEVSLPAPHDMWPDVPTVDITVVVPCYNVERFVRESLRSVLDQECDASFEVIAVDDGSTDSTRDILDSLAADNRRLRVIGQRNKGLSGARNAGLKAANGASIVFVDSDDVLAPEALQTLYRELRRSGADYVTGMYRYIDEKGRVIPVGKKRPSGVAWGRIFDREVWSRLEFPEGVWYEDTVHAYMVAPQFKESTIGDVVYSYRKQVGSITAISRSSKRSVDTYFVTEAMLGWRSAMGMPFNQKMYDQTLYQLGPLLLNRTVALDRDESKCLFVLASNLLKSSNPGGGTSHSSEKWIDLERALLEGDYGLWLLASSSL